MLKKYLLLSVIIFCLLMPFAGLALADEPAPTAPAPKPSLMDNLKSAGAGALYDVNVDDNTIPNTIGKIIAVVLGFVGSIFLILTVYSGIQWMTAGGSEEKVKQAKTRLINGVMGLAVTVMAYFITYLIRVTLLG